MGKHPYHHGSLRQAVIDAAVAEVQAVGASAVSMREIARRAGVSHAAPSHHFGDKAGIFTAIAIEGFRLTVESIRPATEEPFGFLRGGVAYVEFALTHPGHFEVMYRPTLYRQDDPELVVARAAAYAVLDDSAEAASQLWQFEDPAALSITGMAVAHGLATLLLAGNLDERSPQHLTESFTAGMIALGDLARHQRDDDPPPRRSQRR